jgi:sortase A
VIRRAVRLVAAAALVLGLWHVATALSVPAKAWLAPMLIERAWERARAGATGDALKPWPWADTVPVARLDFPRQTSSRVALSGGTERAMAFGPTLVEDGSLPAFFGHRDTHFEILGELTPGDPILWEDADGATRTYRVIETNVAHKDRIRVPEAPDGAMIALVTCWPLDAIAAGGPMRYVVLAVRDDQMTKSASR